MCQRNRLSCRSCWNRCRADVFKQKRFNSKILKIVSGPISPVPCTREPEVHSLSRTDSSIPFLGIYTDQVGWEHPHFMGGRTIRLSKPPVGQKRESHFGWGSHLRGLNNNTKKSGLFWEQCHQPFPGTTAFWLTALFCHLSMSSQVNSPLVIWVGRFSIFPSFQPSFRKIGLL